MGAKQKNEISRGVFGVINLLTKMIIQNGIIIALLKDIRRDLKHWEESDVKNHYEKDKKHTEILETLVNGNGNLRKVEPV